MRARNTSLLLILFPLFVIAVACGAEAADRSSPPQADPTVTARPADTGGSFGAGDSSIETPVIPSHDVEPVSFSRDSGTFIGPFTVELFADSESRIYYTIDGSDPAGDRAILYGSPLELVDSATVQAIARNTDGRISAHRSATYSITLAKLDAPRIASPGGVFGEPQVVTITGGEPVAEVYYTLDGTEPTPESGIRYTGPVTIAETAQLRAVNVRPSYRNSNPAIADYRIYGRRVDRTADIELVGDQQMVIDDTFFLLEGNISLRGNAQLVIRDSFVRHTKDFAFQYGVSARENASIVFENSAIGSNCSGSFNYTLHDNASLEATNIDVGEGSCNVWVLMTDSSTAEIEQWDHFGGTVCSGSNVDIEDSDTIEVELCFPENTVVDTALPTRIDTFNFGPDPSNGVEFELNMRNVSLQGWGINVLPGADITIRDSDAITIGIIAGRPWENETILLDGLEIKRYKDQTWQIGPDASLTLVNTNVYGWEPNVFADNTLVIRNSVYSASAINSGEAYYDISDSTIDLLITGERVTMQVVNSVITGDVIANEDSLIVLIDSEVRGTVRGDDGLFGGNVYTRGNGRVILRNTTVAGEIVEQGNGSVIIE